MNAVTPYLLLTLVPVSRRNLKLTEAASQFLDEARNFLVIRKGCVWLRMLAPSFQRQPDRRIGRPRRRSRPSWVGASGN